MDGNNECPILDTLVVGVTTTVRIVAEPSSVQVFYNDVCGNFDIVLDRFARISQPRATLCHSVPHLIRICAASHPHLIRISSACATPCRMRHVTYSYSCPCLSGALAIFRLKCTEPRVDRIPYPEVSVYVGDPWSPAAAATVANFQIGILGLGLMLAIFYVVLKVWGPTPGALLVLRPVVHRMLIGACNPMVCPIKFTPSGPAPPEDAPQVFLPVTVQQFVGAAPQALVQSIVPIANITVPLNFEIALDITPLGPVNARWSNIIHVTATGENLAGAGSRIPGYGDFRPPF